MKRLYIISFASRAMCIGIVILTILATACKSGGKYVAYHYDNGDDYFCEGLQRIVTLVIKWAIIKFQFPQGRSPKKRPGVSEIL